jgi:subfamily B ATP-binding cassette protein MsbA
MSRLSGTSVPPAAPGPAADRAPFATEGAVEFYRSLILKHWRLFAGMMALCAVYATITAGRLLAGGVLLDAVGVYFGSEPRNFLAGVDAAWRWAAGAGAATISERLRPEHAGREQFFLLFLLVMVVVFALAAAIMALAYFFKEYLGQSLIVRMTVDIRTALFRHLARQSVAYFNRQRSGDVTSRLTNDVNTVQLSFRFFFENIVQDPLTILAALAVALAQSPLLFMITMPFYGILMLPVLRSAKKVIKHGRGRLEKLSLVTEAIQQLFGGIRIVKAFGMERHEERAFDRRNEEFIRSTLKMNRAKIKGRSYQELLYNLGTAAVILLGVWLITMRHISFPSFFVFMGALVQIYNPLKAFSRAWNQIQESQPGVERILEVLREKPLIEDRDGSADFPGLREEIRFEDVSFSYAALDPALRQQGGEAPHLPVLRDVTFSVKAGEVVALVGPSGAGKSTIVDLLARFYDPQKGGIAVDGTDIRDYRHASYLKAIGIVSQDPFLFNTTIRENIRYGRESASDAEIEEAARAAFAHDFIMEQPDGYDTVIGDRGAKLSGGQRQRITIARALLKNAPILILDEATSSLDSQSEREVQCAIDNLIRARTTFVIAHRLSTVVNADKILVIEDGKIVERGCHEELLGKRGRYFMLWRAQNPEAGSSSVA